MKWRDIDEANRLIEQGKRIKIHDIEPWPATWPWPLPLLARRVWQTSFGLPLATLLRFFGIGDPHMRIVMRFEVLATQKQRASTQSSLSRSASTGRSTSIA